MEAAHTSAPTPASVLEEGEVASAVASKDAHLRRCLVTGEMLPKSELLRFVVGPEAALYPDLAQNLPGRGLWVSPTAETLTTAAKKNLFAKAAKTAVKVAPDLVAQVTQLIRKRCLDLIGLARRSGIAAPGQLQVETELKSGKLALLLMADDARSDLSAFRAMKDLHISTVFSRQELGAALGHDQIAYVGFKPHALTAKMQTELKMLEKLAPAHHITHGNGQ